MLAELAYVTLLRGGASATVFADGSFRVQVSEDFFMFLNSNNARTSQGLQIFGTVKGRKTLAVSGFEWEGLTMCDPEIWGRWEGRP